MLKGEAEDALRGRPSDKLDALNNTIYHNVFNSRVLPFSIFTDQNCINIVVWSLVAGNGVTRTNVGKKVKGSTECQIKRNMPFSNRSLFGTIKTYLNYYQRRKRNV